MFKLKVQPCGHRLKIGAPKCRGGKCQDPVYTAAALSAYTRSSRKTGPSRHPLFNIRKYKCAIMHTSFAQRIRRNFYSATLLNWHSGNCSPIVLPPLQRLDGYTRTSQLQWAKVLFNFTRSSTRCTFYSKRRMADAPYLPGTADRPSTL